MDYKMDYSPDWTIENTEDKHYATAKCIKGLSIKMLRTHLATAAPYGSSLEQATSIVKRLVPAPARRHHKMMKGLKSLFKGKMPPAAVAVALPTVPLVAPPPVFDFFAANRLAQPYELL